MLLKTKFKTQFKNVNYKELNYQLEKQIIYVKNADVQLEESDAKILELEKQNHDLKTTNEELKTNLELYISKVKLTMFNSLFFCE